MSACFSLIRMSPKTVRIPRGNWKEVAMEHNAKHNKEYKEITAEIILNEDGLMTSKSAQIVEMHSDRALLLSDSALHKGSQVTVCLKGSINVLSRTFELDIEDGGRGIVVITQAEVVSVSRSTEMSNSRLISVKLIGNIRVQRSAARM
jgi:hypothetical protein